MFCIRQYRKTSTRWISAGFVRNHIAAAKPDGVGWICVSPLFSRRVDKTDFGTRRAVWRRHVRAPFFETSGDVFRSGFPRGIDKSVRATAVKRCRRKENESADPQPNTESRVPAIRGKFADKTVEHSRHTLSPEHRIRSWPRRADGRPECAGESASVARETCRSGSKSHAKPANNNPPPPTHHSAPSAENKSRSNAFTSPRGAHSARRKHEQTSTVQNLT